MILKCITNWTTNRPSPNSLNSLKDQLVVKGKPVTTAASQSKKRRGGRYYVALDDNNNNKTCEASSAVPWNLDDPNFLPETPSTTAITLLGPPKQYFGDSSKDRYAYMLYEAIGLLTKYGYHTNIPVLCRQANMLKAQQSFASSSSKETKTTNTPGVLGFLLQDMHPGLKIAVFNRGNKLVATLSFVAYKQPWLNVCCSSENPSLFQTMHNLYQILSKRFFLVEIPHESKTMSIPIVGRNKATPRNAKFASDASNSITVKMTTGTFTVNSKEHVKDHVLTKFVFEDNDGTVLARAVWSFASDKLGIAGPAMETFETTNLLPGHVDNDDDDDDVSLYLTTMENVMIQIFARIVAFRIRFCQVDNRAGAKTWFSKRGYTKSKRADGGFCKAFVMF